MKLEKNKLEKNKHKNFLEKVKNIAKKTGSLVLLPLLSCALVQQEGNLNKLNTYYDRCEKMSCEIKNHSQIVCTYGANNFKLDVPENIDLKNEKIMYAFYQNSRTVLVTENYIIRAIGCDQIQEGTPWLGLLGDKIYMQNALFISIEQIKGSGDIEKVIISGDNMLVFILKNKGFIIFNVDTLEPPKNMILW